MPSYRTALCRKTEKQLLGNMLSVAGSFIL